MKKIWANFLNWQKQHKTLVALIVTALFVAMHIPILVNHEMGLDEAALWTRASGQATYNTFSYDYDHTEPQTNLWVCLLTPFARLGLPAVTMNVLSLLFVTAAVFLLVRFVRAPGALKLAILLSAVFVYYNPIIARCYSLLPLALVLVVILFEHRTEKPFLYGLSLLFLSQTHFMMFGIVLALTIEEIVKLSKISGKAPRFLLPVVLALAFFMLELVQASGIYISDTINYDLAGIVTDLFSKLSLATFGFDFPFLLLLLLPLAAYMLIRHAREFLGLAISLAFAIIMMFLVYNGDNYLGQKGAALLAIVMFWVLIAIENTKLAENLKVAKAAKIEKAKAEKTTKAEKGTAAPALRKSPKHAKLLAAIGCIIFAIPFLASIPRNVAAISEDMNGEFSYSAELSEFIDWLYLEKNSATIVVMHEARDFILPELARGKHVFYDTLMGDEDEVFSVHETYETHPVNVTHVVSEVARVRELIDRIKDKYDHVYLLGSGGFYQYNCSAADTDAGNKIPAQYADNITENSMPYATFIPDAKNDYTDLKIIFDFYKIK